MVPLNEEQAAELHQILAEIQDLKLIILDQNAELTELLMRLEKILNKPQAEIPNEQPKTRKPYQSHRRLNRVNPQGKTMFLESFPKLKSTTKACKFAHVTSRTFYKWLKEDETFAAQFEKISSEIQEKSTYATP